MKYKNIYVGKRDQEKKAQGTSKNFDTEGKYLSPFEFTHL